MASSDVIGPGVYRLRDVQRGVGLNDKGGWALGLGQTILLSMESFSPTRSHPHRRPPADEWRSGEGGC